MNIPYARTDNLDLRSGKQLLSWLQKPRKDGAWNDWSGAGGVEISEKIDDIDSDRIVTVILPDYCNSFQLTCWDYKVLEGREILEPLFFGGDYWMPPEYGGRSEIRFYVMPKGFHNAVTLTFSKLAGMRWFSRSYDHCVEITLSLGNRLDLITLEELIGNRGVEENLMELWRSMSLPDEHAKGFIEAVHFENSHSYYFDIDAFPIINNVIRKSIKTLLDESPIQRLYLWSCAELGGQAKFEGESYHVTEIARYLLAKVAAQNGYPSYKVNYSYLGPRSWNYREKSRKKWKQPIHEELGTATLENGAVAKVSLGIEKEGYVFYLNFESDDDFIKFYSSKLFQKAKWHSGAE